METKTQAARRACRQIAARVDRALADPVQASKDRAAYTLTALRAYPARSRRGELSTVPAVDLANIAAALGCAATVDACLAALATADAVQS